MLENTINLTPLFLVAGLGILSVIFEKTFSKAGSETAAYFTGIVSLLIGFLFVIYLVKGLINQVINTFFIEGSF
jgi:sorbitol-specific phosphotransferase system component IIC